MVYYPQKPARIRVVFDCSIEYKYCLNKEVLQGTDLTNQLIGVFLRFRQGEVAVIVDIDALPSQVTKAVPRLPLISVVPRQRLIWRSSWLSNVCLHIWSHVIP